MNIVFFSNPTFSEAQGQPQYSSMVKFTKMLVDGMVARGHQVTVWMPRSVFSRYSITGSMIKWMGYLDQYLVFPTDVKSWLKDCPPDTLFVFTDQAQGPWIPLVADRNHVVHCHDFMALSSAKGNIPENKTRWTGKQYQKMIYNGFSKGKHFISVSHTTKEALETNLSFTPLSSSVVYNGMNKILKPLSRFASRTAMGIKVKRDLKNGYILHVGGNQWYKNRTGVVEIYIAWRQKFNLKTLLILVGAPPAPALLKLIECSAYKNEIIICSNLKDEELTMAYSGADVFLFPSLAEGFGWPIAEAMASGCPVITTNEAPMTEVGGTAATFISRKPFKQELVKDWAMAAAHVLNEVLRMSPSQRKSQINASILNATRFNTSCALDNIEMIYHRIATRQIIDISV
jgi:glycosyltransferase involved in cell wall biosynthesis